MRNTNQITHPRQHVTFDAIAKRCDDLKARLAAKGITFHRDSVLGKVLREAEFVASEWERGENQLNQEAVRDTAHAQRIASACIAAIDDPDAAECLRRVVSKNTDLSTRDISQGKDALWELELAELMRRKGHEVRYIDPPDLICNFDFGLYPIACKKIYSPNGVEDQVRKGVKQLGNYGSPGIVAINIDDTIPPNGVLNTADYESAVQYLDHFVHLFISQHRPKLMRFLGEPRCDGLLIAATAFAVFTDDNRKYNTVTTTFLWSKQTLDYRVAARLNSVRRVFSQR